jgi:hypothetical protein
VGAAKHSETLLKLQISTDFLLEGLGAKQAKIHEFNLEFEKAMTRLKGSIAAPLNLPSGALVVSLTSLPEAERADSLPQKQSFRVRVVAQDMTKAAALANSTNVNTLNTIPRTNEPGPADATMTGGDHESNEIATSAGTTFSTTGPSVTGTETNKATPSTLPANEKLKQEFLQVIQNWQNIKKKAVRQGQTNDLGSALAGKALARQTDAVKWLSANHKYYDMTPKGASVEHVAELVAEKKYSVAAQVKENTKYVDEKSGQLLKESNDTYHVLYIVEKIGGHWLITDFSIIKSPSQTPAPKIHH